jgi:hypothetical protein
MKRSSAFDGNRGTRNPLRHVSDDADVVVRLVGMDARWVRDRVDVCAADIERGSIRNEPIDGAARGLDDHERVVRIE